MKKLVVLILFFTMHAQADVLEVGLGQTFGRYLSGDTSNALNLSYLDRDKKYPIEYGLGFVGGSDGVSGSLGKDQMYVSIGVRKYWDKAFFGFGVALVSETNARLSTPLNFKSQLGYSFRSFVVKVEHISNGDVSGVNDGENIFTLAYAKAL